MDASHGDRNKAIVLPRPLKGFAELPSFAVLVGNEGDTADCRSAFGSATSSGRMFSARISTHFQQGRGAVIAGPVLGAPQAAMTLEMLIAGGVREIVYLGWCGAIVPHLRIGDFVLPPRAFINEGTSPQYQPGGRRSVVDASPAWIDLISRLISAMDIRFQKEAVWTTDALFRETPQRIAYFRRQGAVAVEMETSALYSVARFHGARIGSILVVSDELGSGTWKPGFTDRRFRERRKRLLEVARHLWEMA